jgi:membrane associated rhomboid family serine protease
MIGTLLLAYIKKWMMTYALVITNILVFILTFLFQDDIIGRTFVSEDKIIMDIAGLGFRPIYLSLDLLPQIYTLFTSMFVHGGIYHIIGNMLVFIFMGIAFEQRIGWKNFLFIYFITGVCGALTHSCLNLGSPVTLIGASGAIFGILGAFAYSFPRDEVIMPIPIGIMLITRIKVIYAALFFAAMETLIVMLDVKDTTAHFAHLGGLISGIILASILIRSNGNKVEKNKPSVKLSDLKELATTPYLEEVLQKIENENVEPVRNAWLEYFFERVKCPVCKKPLNHRNRVAWCGDHFRAEY